MDEKRMVGDYTVINSMYIGHREIILGENPKAASGERYVCCYAERVMFYEQYLEAQVSDDFAEIVKLYGERVTQAADEIMKETEKVTSEIGMNDEITAKDCKPISHDDAIEDKVIVIRGNVLRPEFRHASHQLMRTRSWEICCRTLFKTSTLRLPSSSWMISKLRTKTSLFPQTRPSETLAIRW